MISQFQSPLSTTPDARSTLPTLHAFHAPRSHDPPPWLCVRTQSKREHIAANWLRTHLQIDVFLPRIRFQRPQPRGRVWFTEALFPNYLFARFDLSMLVHQVDFAPGVRGVVRFGDHCPRVPDAVVESLLASVGPEQVRVVDHEFHPGETVGLAAGAFHGLEAVVTRFISARQRVTVLLEFLGRQSVLDLPAADVTSLADVRLSMFKSGTWSGGKVKREA